MSRFLAASPMWAAWDTHTLEIAWGDGTTSPATIDPVARTFTASHTYPDDDPSGTASDAYAIDLTLSDDDGGVATAQVQTLVSQPGAGDRERVGDACGGRERDGHSVGELLGRERSGQPHAGGRVGRRDDVVGDDRPGSADIHGEPHLPGRRSSGTASDVYAIDLTLSDDDGGVATAQVQTVVSNVAPVIESVSATPAVDEHGTVTVSGSFSDTGSLDTHTLAVAWGDGTTSTATIDPVARTFTASHTYLDDDPSGTASDVYAIDLALSDDDGGVATAQLQTVVSNVAPAIESVSATPAVDENGTVTVSGSLSDVGSLDTHTLAVAWGDGTTSAATIDPVARTFTASHTYPDDDPTGTASDAYAIDLTLSDDDGGVATAQVQTVVSNVAPVIESVSATPAVDENGTVTVSGSFSDASRVGHTHNGDRLGRRDDVVGDDRPGGADVHGEPHLPGRRSDRARPRTPTRSTLPWATTTAAWRRPRCRRWCRTWRR